MKRLAHYLQQLFTLGVIVGAMPNQIANGQSEDANPVMANFNFLKDQINNNIPPLIPSVGVMTLYAPTWSTVGVQPVIGNGTLAGQYLRSGNLVQVVVTLLYGSTTTPGTQPWKFSLPFPYVGAAGSEVVGASWYQINPAGAFTLAVSRVLISDPSNASMLDATAPVGTVSGAWGAGSTLHLTTLYSAG